MDDPLTRILAIVREAVAPGAELGPESLAKDVKGWDSGAMVAILFTVEDAFGLTLTSQEMEAVAGVPDLMALCGRGREPLRAADPPRLDEYSPGRNFWLAFRIKTRRRLVALVGSHHCGKSSTCVSPLRPM